MTIAQLPTMLDVCDKANISPLIESKHGIGKSSIIKQFAKDNNMECEILILSLLDVGDLAGLPISQTIGGQEITTWSSPAWHGRIVNNAWAEILEIEDLEFIDKEFGVFFRKKQGTSTNIKREELNKIYCEYKGINTYTGINPLLQQTIVQWTKAKRTVLALDEFNRSATDILNASLQLVLDKRLNDHVLPVVDGKQTLVIAAINPENENYTVNSLDPALLDRFMHIMIEPDLEAFLSYARSKKLNPYIGMFLLENKDKLYFEPSEDTAITATPRSWDKLSNVINILQGIGKEYHLSLIKGLIGKEIGIQFLQFINTNKSEFTYEEVENFAKKELSKCENDVNKAAKELKAKITNKQEAIKQLDMAQAFYDNYVKLSPEKCKPFLVYMYSMNIEQATSFIVSTKKDDPYLDKFADMDMINDKKLLVSILSSTKSLVLEDESA